MNAANELEEDVKQDPPVDIINKQDPSRKSSDPLSGETGGGNTLHFINCLCGLNFFEDLWGQL